jgi:hypothetical protein
MNLYEFRQEMESYRRSVDEEARALKHSYLALEKLHALYRRFDAVERRMADQVLAEWALSDDEGLRFDALALIDDFKVTTAAAALQLLAGRLALSTAPGAPYELERVDRILEDLGSRPHAGHA